MPKYQSPPLFFTSDRKVVKNTLNYSRGRSTARLNIKMQKTRILAAFWLIVMVSTIAIHPVEASPGSAGAKVTLGENTVHVSWQFNIEYDSSQMAEAADDLHEALKYNYNREIETQMESLITDALMKTNVNMSCKNVKIVLETDIGTWANVLVDFDISGAISTEEHYRVIDMSWRAFTVKGKVKFFHDHVEYGFYPSKSCGLRWPFSSKMETWNSEEKYGSTIFTNLYRQEWEIIPSVTLNKLNMTITIPGTATGTGDYIRVEQKSSESVSTTGLFPQANLYINLGIIFTLGTAVLLGTIYLWAQRERSNRAARVAWEVGESPIIKEYTDALDKWEYQDKWRRLERKTIWHGGSVIFRIPNLKLSKNIQNHYFLRYTEEGEVQQ